MGGVRFWLAALGVLAGCAALAPAAGAATFSNPTPITDPSQMGPDSPYPSEISVSGQAGTAVKVTATLIGVNGGPERDLDVLLVGPGGSTQLVSDVCSVGGVTGSFGGVTLTLDDEASAPLPQTCGVGVPATGAYKPTNYDTTTDSFPGIAPPYLLGLGNFRGVSPNGVWQLYVVDDTFPDPVTIDGGWSLDVTTTGAPATAPTPTTTRKRTCKKRKHRATEAAKKKRCKKRKRR